MEGKDTMDTMTVLLAVCAVVVTIAVAATAIATVRAINRFENTAQEIQKTAEMLRGTIAQTESVIREVHELTDSLGGVVPPLRRAANGVEHVTNRAVRLSSTVLNEIEAPVRTTMALLNGVRNGTRSLFGALTRRVQHSHSNGGYRDVQQ
jgi:uncharacterized protein YoxC